VFARDRLIRSADPTKRNKEQREQVKKPQRLEKDAPVTRPALFIQHRTHQPLQHLAFPNLATGLRFCHATLLALR
jgi:hypothetical protein